jgi:hypothetical protein
MSQKKTSSLLIKFPLETIYNIQNFGQMAAAQSLYKIHPKTIWFSWVGNRNNYEKRVVGASDNNIKGDQKWL